MRSNSVHSLPTRAYSRPTKSGSAHPAERGFTAIELLVAMGISLVISGIVFQFLSSGGKSYKKGSERLDLVNTYSTVIERLKREIREASFNIEVAGNKELKFTKFEISKSTGLPVDMDNDGFFEETPAIIYRIETEGSGDEERTILTREFANNKRVICDSLLEGSFKLEIVSAPRRLDVPKKYLEEVSERIPTIHVNLKLGVAGKETNISTVIIPRYIANWAKDPSWVTNSRGQTLKYVY